jgi:hypothetical protein
MLPAAVNSCVIRRHARANRWQSPEPVAQIINPNESLAAVFRGDEIAVLNRLVKRGSTDPRGSARLGDCQSKLFQDSLAIVGRFDSGGQARVRAGDGGSI